MASNTRNVKLGVCKVIYHGTDLGYTQGGVEVTVKTDTHKVVVDQFGKTTINEYLMGREVAAKVPLAETTCENLVAIMPGATLIPIGATPATGSVTIVTNPAANDTIVIDGDTVTFKSALTGAVNEVLLGATAVLTAAALAAALNASNTAGDSQATYTVVGAVVTASAPGVAGNAFTLAAGTAGVKVTVSGATLTGGVDATSKSVSVTTGVGINLLDQAHELRLHPISKLAGDVSEDFVIPLAATAGALNFAYKLESERIFNVDFTGYPDATTGKLFTLGA